MKKYIFVGIALLLISSLALADMPKYITVQGTLTDKNDEPIVSVSYPFIFRIYKTEFPCPGNPANAIFTQSPFIPVNGTFYAILDLTGFNLGFNESYWLETTASGEVLCPHVRMTSSAYTFSAGRLLPTTYPINTTSDVNATRFCLPPNNCLTNWPSGGGGGWAVSGNNVYNTTANVGIGTSSPGYKLNVVGDANITGPVLLGNNKVLISDAGLGGLIHIKNNSGTNKGTIYFDGANTLFETWGNALLFNYEAGSGRDVAIGSGSNAVNVTINNGSLSVGAWYMEPGTVNARKLCILGVCKSNWDADTLNGLSSSAFQRDIGIDCNANNYVYGVQDDGTLKCRSDQTGGGGWVTSGNYLYNSTSGVQVGIGTATPGCKLTVGSGTISGAASFHDLMVTDSADARIGTYVNNKGVSTRAIDGTYADLYAYDYGAGTGLNLTLNQYGGNVGIGTNNPGYKLDVAGQARIQNDLYLNKPLIFAGSNWAENTIRFGSGAGTNAAGFIGPNDPTYNGMVFQMYQQSPTDKPDNVQLWINETGQNDEDVFYIERVTTWSRVFGVRGNGDLWLANNARIGMNGDISSEPRSIKLRSNLNDEWNSGTIAYRPSWDTSVLAIVGANNTATGDRRVRIYDKLCFGTDCRDTWPSGGGGNGWSVGTYVYNSSANTRVGIGTASPSSKLDVNNTDNGMGLTVYTNRSGMFTRGISGVSTGGSVVNYGVYSTATGPAQVNVGLYASADSGTQNWGVYIASGDLLFKPSLGDDAGDVVFQNSAGTQKGRIWTDTGAGVSGLYLSSGDNVDDINISSDGTIRIRGNLIVGGNLQTNCPSGTVAAGTVCIEINSRAALSWSRAASECLNIGRRLPLPSEWFMGAMSGSLSNVDQWEWTDGLEVWQETNGVFHHGSNVVRYPPTNRNACWGGTSPGPCDVPGIVGTYECRDDSATPARMCKGIYETVNALNFRCVVNRIVGTV